MLFTAHSPGLSEGWAKNVRVMASNSKTPVITGFLAPNSLVPFMPQAPLPSRAVTLPQYDKGRRELPFSREAAFFLEIRGGI